MAIFFSVLWMCPNQLKRKTLTMSWLYLIIYHIPNIYTLTKYLLYIPNIYTLIFHNNQKIFKISLFKDEAGLIFVFKSKSLCYAYTTIFLQKPTNEKCSLWHFVLANDAGFPLRCLDATTLFIHLSWKFFL